MRRASKTAPSLTAPFFLNAGLFKALDFSPTVPATVRQKHVRN